MTEGSSVDRCLARSGMVRRRRGGLRESGARWVVVVFVGRSELWWRGRTERRGGRTARELGGSVESRAQRRPLAV